MTLIRKTPGFGPFVAASMLLIAAATASAASVEILRITPTGEDVPPATQILIEFNQPMVPLGRMDRDTAELPVSIEPALACNWRWVNRQALACNLDDADRMAWSTRYRVVVEPGIQAMDGATTAAPVTAEFVTERPSVTWASVQDWTDPGTPVVRVAFNQPVLKESVRSVFRFTVKDSGASTHVTVEADPDDRQLADDGRLFDERLSEGALNDPAQFQLPTDPDAPRRFWLLSPADSLPLDAEVTLGHGAGLRSPLGPEPSPGIRDILTLHTFPEFAFLGVRCTNNAREQVLIAPGTGDLENPQRMCDPLSPVALRFSAPVLASEVKRAVTFAPDLAGGRTDYDPWENAGDHYAYLGFPHHPSQTYDVSLPERLKPFRDYRVSIAAPGLLDTVRGWFSDAKGAGLKDVFGRPLDAAVDVAFWTNHRRPDFKLVHQEAVLEAGIDSEVPLYTTNLDEVSLSYRRLTPAGGAASGSKALEVPEVEDLSFAIPLKARELLGEPSGVVYGAVQSTPAVEKHTRERRFFAQVTPYQVYAKLGHFNTLVWVTDLETGESVAGARVAIYRDALSSLDPVPANAATAVTGADGTALLPGTEQLDPELATFKWNCDEDCPKLTVRIDGGRGMALLPLNYDFRANIGQASNYQVWPSARQRYGHMQAWGTTAQGVYRAGDTIQFKLYVRNQSNEQHTTAPAAGYTLTLTDPTGKVVYERKEVTLNAFGALDGEYTVPGNSVMGWYQFALSAEFTEQRWWPMRVLVTDFTPASFRVTSDLNGDLFRPGSSLVATTRAALHSGGAYTQAEARVTVNLQARGFRSDDPVARTFHFDTANDQDRLQLQQVAGELTGDGAFESTLELGEGPIVYGDLQVESAVRDDRGKYVSAASSARYVALDRFVGLRKDAWVFKEDEPAAFEYLTVDEHGTPVADTEVRIAIERLDVKAARVKSAGNAYTTRFTETWEPVGECQGLPAGAPATCTFTPEAPGSYRMVASIEDTQGRAHSSTLTGWVVGKGRVVWQDDATHALELIPEATEYQVGDTARVLVKNPYPGAAALVTLERYGVLRQWQTTLEGSTPIVEFPIEQNLLPGAYLSVVVFSPRVADPPEENRDGGAELDLGKPAFRVGYLELPVVDPNKRLTVTARTDRDVYRPRERVRITLAAGQPEVRKEPLEYAVVVLDEAVLDLISGGTGYFDPYEGFNALDGLDVENYSLLMRIIGRQQFEKKGANAGGDGGQGLAMRSLFKYVAYWNPALKADADGRARLDVELPDNLTGWRVLALAVTPEDGFGLGEAAFRTNQPTEIRPVMPNQVAEGDGFTAGFAVTNRTDSPRTIRVRIAAAGDVDAGAAESSEEIALAPYERRVVYLPVLAARLPMTRDVREGAIRFTVRAGDAVDQDAIEHRLPVLKRRSLEVAAQYGSLTAGTARDPITLPPNVYPDSSAVSVVLTPTVIGNADGAFRYMRDYPYACWEQKLTKGVMASHFNALAPRLDPTLDWPGSAELPAAILAEAAGFQAPNGGMTYFVPSDQNVSPYLSAYTALAFTWLKRAGHEVPASVEGRLHGYLENLLRRDDVPDFYTRNMSATVRAVALNALVASGRAGLDELARYESHLPYMDVFGAANYLEAALTVDGAEALAEQAVNRVLAHSNTTGGKLTFTDDVDDGYRRILTTPLRSNCAVLSALTRLEDLSRFGLAEAPAAITRAITQARGARDHWENTQENLFCMNALVDYAARFERETPDLTVSVALDEKPLGSGRLEGFRADALTFSTPVVPAELTADSAVVVSVDGAGRLYYSTRLSYAPEAPDEADLERVNAGIDLRREYSVQRNGEWIRLENPAVIKRGELVRVDLFLALPAARNFVVVDDPVPGGLEPVNRDLATSSGVDADAGEFVAAGGSYWYSFGDWNAYGFSRWSFYHKELGHDAVRFYSEYLGPGRYHLSYTAQAIAAGTFAVPPSVAAEMYDPDVYGKTLPLVLEVGQP
ncbi:MAG: alpha-2-macroglobulin [Pseudomonadales bacterium]